jgi:hypothetical protein
MCRMANNILLPPEAAAQRPEIVRTRLAQFDTRLLAQLRGLALKTFNFNLFENSTITADLTNYAVPTPTRDGTSSVGNASSR